MKSPGNSAPAKHLQYSESVTEVRVRQLRQFRNLSTIMAISEIAYKVALYKKMNISIQF